MRFNRYLPFAIIYFFINSMGLPMGLTYTALLGPFFYAWVLVQRKKEILLPFFLFFSPFIIVQVLLSGVELTSYLLSFINIIMIYCFGQAVYTYLVKATDHDYIFKKLLLLNGILCGIALVFYFTPYHNFFWLEQNLTLGISQFRRLSLLTYEPSHYAQLFVPVFLFFLFQYFLRLNKMNGGLLMILIVVPLILSFSIGVISCLAGSLFLVFIVHFRTLAPRRRVVNSFITLAVLVCIVTGILFLFFRDNPFFLRLGNIFSGQDSSGQGRTENAFILAAKILREKNEWWGIGPGQLKIIGDDIIRAYYLYYDQTPVAIPNATAETLMVFGWTGLALRFIVEFVLFFYTKVWKNYFRFALFLFMFSYQFTGSYLTNTAEYVIWILAFTQVFSVFDARVNRVSAHTNFTSMGI